MDTVEYVDVASSLYPTATQTVRYVDMVLCAIFVAGATCTVIGPLVHRNPNPKTPGPVLQWRSPALVTCWQTLNFGPPHFLLHHPCVPLHLLCFGSLQVFWQLYTSLQCCCCCCCMKYNKNIVI